MKPPFKPLDLVVNIHTGEVEMVDKTIPLSDGRQILYFVNSTVLFNIGIMARHYILLSAKEVLINLDVKPKK